MESQKRNGVIRNVSAWWRRNDEDLIGYLPAHIDMNKSLQNDGHNQWLNSSAERQLPSLSLAHRVTLDKAPPFGYDLNLTYLFASIN